MNGYNHKNFVNDMDINGKSVNTTKKKKKPDKKVLRKPIERKHFDFLMNKIEEIAKEKNLDLIIKGVEKSNLLAQKLFKNYAVVNRTRYLKKHN